MPFEPTPSIQFLHNPEAFGELSRYPKANTCACVMYLPTVHKKFEEFVTAVNFGVMNGLGFGLA